MKVILEWNDVRDAIILYLADKGLSVPDNEIDRSQVCIRQAFGMSSVEVEL